MKLNKIYTRKLPLNLQLFAEGEGDPTPTPEGNPKPLTFDELMKIDKNYQSEFDKRVAKALETAKGKWDADQKKTAEELIQQQLKDQEDAITKREAEITRRELKAQALETFGSKGIPKEMADTLDYASEEAMKTSMKNVETAFQKALEKAVTERMKGSAPKAGSAEEVTVNAMRAALGLSATK